MIDFKFKKLEVTLLLNVILHFFMERHTIKSGLKSEYNPFFIFINAILVPYPFAIN